MHDGAYSTPTRPLTILFVQGGYKSRRVYVIAAEKISRFLFLLFLRRYESFLEIRAPGSVESGTPIF